MEFRHTTVLLHEMIDSVLTDPHGIYVDCTLGGGGHSLALSEKLADDGLLIGVDQDQEAIDAASERLKGTACRHLFVRDNFPIYRIFCLLCPLRRWMDLFLTWAFLPISWMTGRGDFPI